MLLIVCLPCRGRAEEYRSPSDGIRLMRYEEGLLSVEAQDASLEKVLSELSKMAKVTVIADGPIEGRITQYLDRVPLDKALRRILRGKDTSFVYAAKPGTSPTQYAVTEVRIYLTGARTGEPRRFSYEGRPAEEASPASRAPGGIAPRRRGPMPMPPPESMLPNPPDISYDVDAQRLLSELMEGDFDGVGEIARRLREENPQLEEQIEEFLESLAEARQSAEEAGRPMPPLQELGNMRTLMQQMLRRGGRRARREPEG